MRWIGLTVMVVGLVVATGVSGEPPRLVVQLQFSATKDTYQEFAHAFETRLAKLPVPPRLLKGEPSQSDAADVLVVIGVRDCETALATSGPPLLCSMVPRLTVAPWLSQTKRAASALYLDQPLERFARLLRLVLPQARDIGWIHSAYLQPEETALTAALDRVQLKLRGRLVTANDNLLQQLDRLLEQTEALLVLADPLVIQPENTYPMLLTTYRHNVPLIAFSRAYVDAGALAAVYATPAQQGEQAAAMVAEALTRSPLRLPAPQLARTFTVTTNRQVVRVLNLSVPDDAALERGVAP